MRRSLRTYLAFKLATALLAVAGAVVLLMALTRLIPGDSATVILGSRATPDAVARLTARMGLDKPLGSQVLGFFLKLARGDLGDNVFNGRPVVQLVGAALPNTAALAVSASLAAILIGIPLALVSARRPDGKADRLIAFLSIGFISTPSFVVSVFLLLVFAVSLHLFPVLGAGEGGTPSISSGISLFPPWRSPSAGSATSRASCAPPFSKCSARTMSAPCAPMACRRRGSFWNMP